MMLNFVMVFMLFDLFVFSLVPRSMKSVADALNVGTAAKPLRIFFPAVAALRFVEKDFEGLAARRC